MNFANYSRWCGKAGYWARMLVFGPALPSCWLAARHPVRSSATGVLWTALDVDLRLGSLGHATARRRHGGKLPARTSAHESKHQEPSRNRLLHGRLTCQIEHHLFPTMPANRLQQVQKIVRAYCASHEIPYHETSLFQSFREVYEDLRKNSLMVREESEGNKITNRRDL
jgi:hypothetical protein